MSNQIETIIRESILVKNKILKDPKIINIIGKSVSIILEALKKGNKLYFCGNGGSAADAQHLAAEFTGRFYLERKALPAEALHCNTSYLTAVANDYSYEDVYSRLLEGISKPGDVLIGISTSGNSKNIIKALRGKQIALATISIYWLNGGEMQSLCNVMINIASKDTARIQEAHILVGHIICELIEDKLFS